MSWARFFRRRQWDEERARELDAYLEIETEENILRGMPPDQARQVAHRKLGNSTLIREEIYQMNSIGFLESLWQDVRYGIRALAKARAFSFVVIASLALGIGATTAIFSLVNAALLKMLPVKDPEQLVQFKSASPSGLDDDFSYAAFKEFRDRNQVFSGVLAFRELAFDANLEVNGQGGIAKCQLVSGSYFSALGIKPAIGRMITPADETVAGQSAVAVISYDYWRARFALDTGVVGEKVVLNNTPYTIVGVTPPEFFGLRPGGRIDVSVPITMYGQINPGFAQTGTRNDVLTSPFRFYLNVMARLRPGVTEKQALADLQPIFHQSMSDAAANLSGLPFDSPTIRRSFLASTLQLESGGQGLSALRRQFSKPLWILMAIVGLLLLVTCANVANLLLARANARQREIAVRLTVGAGSRRLIRQLITESVVLALSGGALGLFLAFWSARSLLMLASRSTLGIHLQVQPDTAVLSFTLLVSLFTALLFGFVPAWRSTRLGLSSALVQGTRGSDRAGTRSRLGKALIVFQVAVSLVLLVGAGLLARTLQNLKSFSPGFNKENVLLLSIHPMTVGYKDAQAALLYKDLLDRLNRIPGVRSATFSFFSPLKGPATSLRPKIKGIAQDSGKEMKPVALSEVGPEYFKTLETPILSGRDFSAADQAGSPRVSIINEAAAREYFGVENPVGRYLSVSDDQSWLEIVGVVKETKNRDIRESPVPLIYLPLFQSPEGAATFEVRTAIDPLAMSNAIQRVIRETDSRIPVYDLKTLSEQVDDSLIQERLVASLSGLFGLLALTLATVGLYGLMTYSTNRRTGEIGIRVALGATRGQIAGMILRETVLLVLVGLAIGIPAAMLSSHLIRSELYGLKADDPLTIVVASSIMAAIAIFAGYLPARRASYVDPMVVLRAE